MSQALLEKLLRTGHLSVPERRALGPARRADVVAVVARGLASTGWFPAPLSGDGEQAAIERTAAGYVVHEQHEIGVLRFGPVQTHRHPTLEAAVEAWLAASGWARAIDGVPIERS